MEMSNQLNAFVALFLRAISHVIYRIGGWVSSQTGFDAVDKRIVPCLWWESNLIPRQISPLLY
jgi:hypothetical protein